MFLCQGSAPAGPSPLLCAAPPTHPGADVIHCLPLCWVPSPAGATHTLEEHPSSYCIPALTSSLTQLPLPCALQTGKLIEGRAQSCRAGGTQREEGEATRGSHGQASGPTALVTVSSHAESRSRQMTERCMSGHLTALLPPENRFCPIFMYLQ